ncbi:MAG TPA: hypothetical protein VJY39_17855 [Acidisphaera sp.]|nr:hypothetical protein [Acidisphaera sp.]
MTIGGTATAHLDRPLAADGGAFPIAGDAVLGQTVTAASTQTTILGGAPTPTTSPPTFGVALENALIGVRAPTLFLITGPTTGTAFTRADVALLLPTLWLLPTLPDPYAANFEMTDLIRSDRAGTAGTMGIAVVWTGSGTLTFGFELGTSAATAILSPPAAPPSIGPAIDDLLGLTLLDLSTSVDLFGVAVTGQRGAPATVVSGPGFVGLSLALPDTLVASFAVPLVSWEPMDSTGPEAPLGAIMPLPATDGFATVLRTADARQTLVPLAPGPVLLQNIANVAAGGDFSASFSLPFGLTADIFQANSPPTGKTPALFLSQGGVYALTQPSFPAQVSGALQLTLKPPNPTSTGAQFSGSTNVSTAPSNIATTPGYGYDVLSSDVGNIFQGVFGGSGPAVPLNRIDIAGYGGSLFSEWINPAAAGTTILKVQFEVIRGRTAYEVVKAKTTLYPYCVPLVRTITITRQNSGWVQRADSGWVAAAPGRFVFPSPSFTPALVNRGAVAGVYNVRNVVEFETVVANAFTYRRVLFDADIGLDYRVKVSAGGTASTLTDVNGKPVTLVPATGLTGYVQIAPDETAKPAPPPPLPPLNPAPADLAALFTQVGAITDPLACIAEIGYSASLPGTSLRCAAIEINMTPAGSSGPALGVALRAAPVLPRDGAWGFGKRPGGAAAPLPLPGNFPVPIVQPNTDPTNWHVADIVDVLRLATPSSVYGLLQDTGTQRTLFEQPIIKDLTGAVPPGTVPSIQLPSGVGSVLADVGSLLNATGLFPDISKALNLVTSALEELKTIPQGLAYSKTVPVPNPDQPTTLLDLGILQINLTYPPTPAPSSTPSAIVFNIDPAHTLPDSHGRNWWLTIGPLAFAVIIPEFGSDPLLTIVGSFAADDVSKPGLTGLTIDYGSALNTLKSIFSKLQALANFLPGGVGAGLNVSLSDGKLTVRDTFALPTLPLGLGDLSDISLDLGLTITLAPLSADFLIGIGDPDNPFNWLLSPLAGNGAIDIGVQSGAPYFMIQGGIGLGLGIDLGIAEGSASITLAVQITVNGSKITIMIILNGQASVDVLGGLASASLSLTAAVGVSIQPFPIPQISLSPPGVDFPAETITFIASVAVGIHISICWVISVSFEGSWQFSQSITTPEISVQA